MVQPGEGEDKFYMTQGQHDKIGEIFRKAKGKRPKGHERNAHELEVYKAVCSVLATTGVMNPESPCKFESKD